MRQPGENKLTRRMEQAILCLLSEPTQEKAADKAGVARSTLQRWLQDPEFLARYREARRSLVETGLGLLQQATGQAVATLVKLLDDRDAKVQARAALGLIDRAVKGVELADLVHQVEELQRRLDEQEAQRKRNGR